MDEDGTLIPAYPLGELEDAEWESELAEQGKALETLGGKVFVRWDPDAAVTAFGPVTYFIEFLKGNGLWQRWVEECPVTYRSGNAPPKQAILGTVLLNVLQGH